MLTGYFLATKWLARKITLALEIETVKPSEEGASEEGEGDGGRPASAMRRPASGPRGHVG
jgi:hypothetical protein